MDPEEMVRAYIELGQPNCVPAHYDVFPLTDEPYGEALVLLEKAKQKYQVGEHIKVLEVGQAYYVPW
jgi:L-ascorbate metabolism protein UlaG (beta-lactamase superfamily)